MLKKSLPAVLAVVVISVLWAQQTENPKPTTSAEYKIPPEDAKRVNPVKPSPESHARAKKFYGIDCAMCHGPNGDGKGDMASDMKGITDFTDPNSLKDRTDGELFYAIRKGKGEMPPEDNRAKDDDVWSMVNYVRAFAKKK